MTEILHPFLTKFRHILRGILDQYFLEKECFRSNFYPILWLSAIMKLDFLKKSGKIRYCQAPARYEIRQYFQRSRMLAAIDQQEDTKSWGILWSTKGSLLVLTFHVIRSSSSSYSSPVNFLEIQRNFPWYSFSNVAIATQHAKTFDRGVPPSLPRFTCFGLYTVNSVLWR